MAGKPVNSCFTVTAVDVLGSADIFASLLPLILAYIGPVASQDPRVGHLLYSLWFFFFFFPTCYNVPLCMHLVVIF